jgi:hypothetical protein
MRKLQNDNPADELYARLAQASRYENEVLLKP